MYIRQHPYRMQSDVHGFSPGLNKCPPDTCLHQCAHWCRPFKSLLRRQKIKDIQKDVLYFLCLLNTIDAIRFYSNLNFHSSNSIMSITSSRVFCLPKILFNPAPFTLFSVAGAARPYGREFTQLMQRRTDNSL